MATNFSSEVIRDTGLKSSFIIKSLIKGGNTWYCLESGGWTYSVTVTESGDYVCRLNGECCFARSPHHKMIDFYGIKGDNVTAKEFYNH
jgi:hypothetical protein